MNQKSGILIIGDPHVSSRVPGHRKDDYMETILGKLEFAFRYAESHNMLPVITGDLFHYPVANSNSLIGRLIQLFSSYPPVGICGNHDVSRNELSDDDSISLLNKAGCYHILDLDGPWAGKINGQPVIIGGTSWGKSLPDRVDPSDLVAADEFASARVVWITHHDLKVPSYEEIGHLPLTEIQGIDYVVNGHIHRGTEPVHRGQTSWYNFGNITRLTRSEFSKNASPSVFAMTFERSRADIETIALPFRDFEEVFHEHEESDVGQASFSETVRLLGELTSRRTDSGAGLESFLAANLHQFDEKVQQEINKLKDRVLHK